jgi:hypothetical protein
MAKGLSATSILSSISDSSNAIFNNNAKNPIVNYSMIDGRRSIQEIDPKSATNPLFSRLARLKLLVLDEYLVL